MGPWRRRGHQDVHVQMLFYEVVESWAVDELDPIILLGFDPASRREPRCGDENPPARAFLIHGANQLTDVTYTNDRQIPLGLDDREATNQRVSVDDHCVDAVIARTLGSPTFQSARFEQLSNKVLELGRRHLG